MRAVVGLVLLVAVALAGVGTFAGPEHFVAALRASGLDQYWPQSADAPKADASGPVAEAPGARPQASRYTPFRTIAVSETAGETDTVATGPAPAVSSSLVGRTEIAPPSAPASDAASGRPGKSSDSASGDKKGRYKLACSAGQRLDHVHHRCVQMRHASGAHRPRG